MRWRHEGGQTPDMSPEDMALPRNGFRKPDFQAAFIASDGGHDAIAAFARIGLTKRADGLSAVGLGHGWGLTPSCAGSVC